MNWLKALLFGIKREKHETEESNGHVEQVEEDIKEAEKKLQEDKSKLPDLERAVASARRVHYRVDKFTEEYTRAFGRVNNG